VTALAASQREFLAALPPVHARNIAVNLHESLAATYPVVRRLVGEPFFREAAARYSQAHPPRCGDLHAYGRQFAAFLRAYAHAGMVAYLADVARLEWACHEAEHAAEAPSMDFAALASVPAGLHERIVFLLQPAARLLASDFRVAALWHANQPDRDGAVVDVEAPEYVLIFRLEGLVRVAVLAPAEWRFLEALSRHASLAEATASAGESDARHVLSTSLTRFVAEGVICAFRLPGA
jgi:hypothetical protein